jgi:hypothetical protein
MNTRSSNHAAPLLLILGALALGQTTQDAPKGHAPKNQVLGGITVTQNGDLWWFNGAQPQNYNTFVYLTAVGATTGTFMWDVVAGNVALYPAYRSVTIHNDNRVILTGTGASPGASGGVKKDVQINLTINGTQVATYSTVVFAPDHLDFMGTDAQPDSVYGYLSRVHYRIRDQFYRTLPDDVELNEKWTGSVVKDWTGGGPYNWWRHSNNIMSWALVHPADWVDNIGGAPVATAAPQPVGPSVLGSVLPVQHWPGQWAVGSLTVGAGTLMCCEGPYTTCTWRKFLGWANHHWIP